MLGEHTDPIARYAAALLVPGLEDLSRALGALPAHEVRRLGESLGLPQPMLARTAQVIVRAIHRRQGRVSPEVGFTLAKACIDDTIDALGARHEDPSVADMAEVLPGVIERHGASITAVMLASYPLIDAPCTAVFETLLRTDERFATLEPAEVALAEPTAIAGPAPAADEGEQAAKREARRQRRADQKRQRAEAKAKSTASTRRASSRRSKPTADLPPAPPAEPAAATTEAAPPPVPVTAARRPARLHGTYPGVDTTHADVGRVVAAEVVFDGTVGAKVRPVVVVGVLPDGYVVRPCSSEGGSVSRNWKSVPIQAWREAGLEQPTWVSHQERVVLRHQIGGSIGRLTVADWNQVVG